MSRFSEMSPEEITEVFTMAREAHVANLKRAGMFGTHGHDLVDRYMTDWITTGERKPDITVFAFTGISNEGVCVGLSAMKLFEDYDMFPVASELKVLSKKGGYAWTLDSLWLRGDVYKERVGEPACAHTWLEKGSDKVLCASCGRQLELHLGLWDWKSSNTIFQHPEYAAQVALYSQALTEMCDVKPDHHWIVRLDKTIPKYEIGVIPDVKEAIRAGLAISYFSDWWHNKEQQIYPLNGKQTILL